MIKLKKSILSLALALALCTSASGFASAPVEIVQAASGGYVIGSNVNLRSGPGTKYSSAGYVQYGDTFRYLSHSGNWCKVKMLSGSHKGDKGYIHFSYITLK